MKCPVCEGGGKHHYFASDLCQLCKGTGSIPDDRAQNPSCPPCGGTGRHHYYPSKLCDVCGGWGRLPLSGEERPPLNGVLVSLVEAGKPRTAYVELSRLFCGLTGTVRVCDPYYGTGSLLRLDLLAHCTEVRFLTRTPDSGERTILPRAISEFRREHPNTDFRSTGSSDFHDRFILSDNELIILGHGLKDLGNKESFIIKLPAVIASDVIDAALDSFNRKWATATPL